MRITPAGLAYQQGVAREIARTHHQAALDVGAEVIHDAIRFKDQAQMDAFTARLAEIPFNYPPLPPVPVPRA